GRLHGGAEGRGGLGPPDDGGLRAAHGGRARARGRRGGDLRLARRAPEVHGRAAGGQLALVGGNDRGRGGVGERLRGRGGRRLQLDEVLEGVLARGRGGPGLQVLAERDRELVGGLVAVVEALGQRLLEDWAQGLVLRPPGP